MDERFLLVGPNWESLISVLFFGNQLSSFVHLSTRHLRGPLNASFLPNLTFSNPIPHPHNLMSLKSFCFAPWAGQKSSYGVKDGFVFFSFLFIQILRVMKCQPAPSIPTSSATLPPVATNQENTNEYRDHVFPRFTEWGWRGRGYEKEQVSWQKSTQTPGEPFLTDLTFIKPFFDINASNRRVRLKW